MPGEKLLLIQVICIKMIIQNVISQPNDFYIDSHQVFFRSPEDADVAISMLDGRLYITGSDQRVLSAAAWDGKTKYKVNETEEEERERLANWEKFLQDETPSKTSDET